MNKNKTNIKLPSEPWLSIDYINVPETHERFPFTLSKKKLQIKRYCCDLEIRYGVTGQIIATIIEYGATADEADQAMREAYSIWRAKPKNNKWFVSPKRRGK